MTENALAGHVRPGGDVPPGKDAATQSASEW